MRRSVVLKLLARGKVQMAHRYGRLVSDPVPPAKSRQRRVGKLGPFRRQLLMDSHQIPLALLEKLQDLLPIGFGFLWTLQLRHSAGVRAQHFAYRHSRYPQDPRNFPLPHPLRMQFENYRSLCLTQHAFPPEEVFPGCRGVVWQSARSAAAPASRRWARCTIALTISRSRISSAAGPAGAFSCLCVLKNNAGSLRMRWRIVADPPRQAAYSWPAARVSQWYSAKIAAMRWQSSRLCREIGRAH